MKNMGCCNEDMVLLWVSIFPNKKIGFLVFFAKLLWNWVFRQKLLQI